MIKALESFIEQLNLIIALAPFTKDIRFKEQSTILMEALDHMCDAYKLLIEYDKFVQTMKEELNIDNFS